MESAPGHPSRCELTVVIPVFNEIKTLPEIIRRVQALPVEKEIIVVDNASTDGTREFVKSLEGIRKVFQPRNLGRGASVRKGIELATGEYTAIHDADLEYCPKDLVQMLAIAKGKGADAVYGSRVLGGRKTNYYSYYLGTRFLTAAINVLCGAHLTDAGTALKMARTSLLQQIEQRCSGFDWDFEITTKLCLANVRIVEYAARYRPRTREEGKKITALDGLPSLKAIVWSWAAVRLFKFSKHLMAILLAVSIPVLLLPRLITALYAQPRLFSVEDVPSKRVAIVFGAGLLRDGSPTPALKERVATAADLYFAGKAAKLLMSGDNRFVDYNEPQAMKDYALSLGVPAEAIVLDYAGRRTYDTCYRARDIFGVQEPILVTQGYHLPRTVYTCNALSVNAVGVPAEWRFSRRGLATLYSNLRELPATLIALWDVHISHPLPVLGQPEPVFSSRTRPRSEHAHVRTGLAKTNSGSKRRD